MFADSEGQAGMMLNKSVCRMCWDRYAASSKIKRRGWTEWDDEQWRSGRVMCPKSGDVEFSKTNAVPENCRYRLEHLVSQ